MNYTHIAALSAGANITKVGAKLHTVTINSKGASSSVLTLYDNAVGDNSGNVIAVIDTTSGVVSLRYDCETRLGLSYINATGTSADITICWS